MDRLSDADIDRMLERARAASGKSTTADNQRSGKTWRDGLITARELQTKQFKPVRIILPDLIPEGVTILAGKPKIGKSWLMLDVCVAVAGDRFVLGDKKPVPGDVLYLALEDNQRRLKKRMDKLMGDYSWPERLHLHTEWKRLDQGGLEDIEEWCKAKPERRLICIDTLAKMRPLLGRNEQAYAADYRAIEGLQRIAGQYQVGIVLTHHLRKASSEDDAFDDVSGTLGLTGAADTIVIMKRHSGMVKVYVRGRDIEEGEFAAEFNRESCRWRFVGAADEVFRSQERQAILAVLKDTMRPMSVPEIMAATDRSDRHAIYNLLYKMEKAGDVKHAGRGQWAHPDATVPEGASRAQSPSSVGIVGNQVIDGQAPHNGRQNGANGFQQDSNDPESVGIGVGIAEAANPLNHGRKLSDSNDPHDSNGSERIDPSDPGPFPDFLRRDVSPDRRPALGPPGDSLDDLQ
jgi:predicted MarR family transcription regulator